MKRGKLVDIWKDMDDINKRKPFMWQYITNRRCGKTIQQITAAFQKYCLDHLGEEVVFTVVDCEELKRLRDENRELREVIDFFKNDR